MTLRVTVWGARAANLSVDTVRVVDELDRHSLAVLAGKSINIGQVPEGAPVTVTWGPSSRPRTWYGYVSHTSSAGTLGDDSVQVTAVGATMPLKSLRPSSWSGASLRSVATSLLGDHRLTPIVPNTPKRDYALTPLEESEWAYLVKIAHDEGLVLSAQGTCVVFIDPMSPLQSVLNRTGPVPLRVSDFRFDGSGGGPSGGELHRRVVWGSEAGGAPVAARSVYRPSALAGVRPVPLVERPIAEPVGTLTEAIEKVESTDAVNSWTVTSKSYGPGRSAVTAGSAVAIGQQGTKGGSGLWLVTRAEHLLTVSDQSYMMHLSLGRDGVGHLRKAVTRPLGSLGGPTIPPSRLLQGRWVASWEA